MLNQTSKTADATLPTQSSVEETPKGNYSIPDYLVTDEQLKGTPFVLRWRDGKGWFLTIGDTRLTEPTDTREETLYRLHEEMYSLIAGMIVHVVNLLNKNDIVTEKRNGL